MPSKKKFDLKETAAHLWEKPSVKIYLAVVAFALFAAVTITVFVQLKARESRREARTEANSYTMDELDALAREPGLQELIITSRWDNRDWLSPEPLREPKKRWSAQDVARFWIPPAEMSIRELSENNMLRLENTLQDVP